MKNLNPFKRDKKAEEPDEIDKSIDNIIGHIKTLKERIETIKPVFKEEDPDMIRILERINNTWKGIINLINPLNKKTKGEIKFKYINEMNQNQTNINLENLNHSQFHTHYSYLIKILSQTAQELEAYKRKKSQEKEN